LDNLPDPDVLAGEIVESLESALDGCRLIVEKLNVHKGVWLADPVIGWNKFSFKLSTQALATNFGTNPSAKTQSGQKTRTKLSTV
jgi:hypothetical protein